MYTVLIAEDSKPILRNIRSHLESLGLPLAVAATAANGEEALERLRERPVDILLTDIRMPKLGGMELIEQAKAVAPHLKVVLISGYSDFEYTRQALSLQVFDYLLKPVERSQLEDVLGRLTRHLDERPQAVRQAPGNALESLLVPGQPLRAEIMRRGPQVPLVLCRQPLTPAGQPWTAAQLQAALDAQLPPDASAVLALREREAMLVLLAPAVCTGYSNACELMQTLTAELDARGLHAAAAGRLQPLDPERWADFGRQALRRLDEELGALGTPPLDTAYPGGAVAGGVAAEQLASRFAELILQRQKEPFALKLEEQLARWQQSGVRIAELERFLTVIGDTLATLDPDLDAAGRGELAAEARRLLEQESYDKFARALQAWTATQFERLLASNKKSGTELFQQIDDYLRLNMYSFVSMADLAERFHVSPSYISRIIKRYSERTFVHYYMQMKIEEARRLMADKPQLRIRDISDALAFSDQHYFSKVFKEYAGCTPSEYKERLQEE
ncbi:response regulator [Paenibacillus sp. IB182496]|uniref:Response regulator n=1 Tax=Paenibacillus sabuli TaxID=2772509 RepID=A0A927BN79_9BACL|nr:response regulator [Paenibacillus sabuli]MBD2843643.1 response regulator [Paenibacillus sabuli]